MPETAPEWVVPTMRTGFAARGVVYTVVGALALLAAIRGGEAQGTTDALADLAGTLWGTALLWLIGAGLFCYAVWRFIDAWMDLQDHGPGAKGAVARAGLVITGLIHAGLGASAIRTAFGGSGGGGEGRAESLTAQVLAWPGGVWIVAAVGLGTLGAGLYYGYKGASGSYREDIRDTPTTVRLDPAMKAGYIAEGLVVGLVGVLILIAAMTANPENAGGVGEALGEIRAVAFGRILLGIVAIGLVFFALANYVEAIYRIVPRCAGTDVGTLAERARAQAARHLRRVTG